LADVAITVGVFFIIISLFSDFAKKR